MKEWRKVLHHRTEARRWNDGKYYFASACQVTQVVRRLDIGMHLMALVGTLVQYVLHNFFVAGIEEDLTVKGDDVGDSRSKISRTDNTNGLIR